MIYKFSLQEVCTHTHVYFYMRAFIFREHDTYLCFTGGTISLFRQGFPGSEIFLFAGAQTRFEFGVCEKVFATGNAFLNVFVVRLYRYMYIHLAGNLFKAGAHLPLACATCIMSHFNADQPIHRSFTAHFVVVDECAYK